MVSQRPEDFITPNFVKIAADTLTELGFISDEHDFVPYRETVNQCYSEIEDALRKEGHDFALIPGFIMHNSAGYAYFTYDKFRFQNSSEAKRAVSKWLDEKYKDDAGL